MIWKKIQVRAGLKNLTKIEQHIWCLSTGRVGTNTLAELGKEMPGVLSLHEPQPLLFGLGKQAYQSKGDRLANAAIVAGLQTCRRELRGLNQSTYLETSPHVTFVARQLKELFPTSKFIHIIRHPADVVRSGMRRKWYGGNPTDVWRIEPESGSELASQWCALDALEKNIWSWAETNRWINQFLDEIPESDRMMMTSESLFEGEESTIEQFFEFCGSPLKSRGKVERVLGRKLNSQETGGFPTAQNWSSSQRKRLVELAGDVMERFGYSV